MSMSKKKRASAQSNGTVKQTLSAPEVGEYVDAHGETGYGLSPIAIANVMLVVAMTEPEPQRSTERIHLRAPPSPSSSTSRGVPAFWLVCFASSMPVGQSDGRTVSDQHRQDGAGSDVQQ